MYSGGSGTSGDPYLIATPQDLNDVRNNLAAYFKQTDEIDLDVAPYNVDPGWVPINNFTGDYDGDGHFVQNPHINRDADEQGIFGIVSGGHIHGLGVEGVDFIFDTAYDTFRVGVIAGELDNGALVEKCWVKSGTIFVSTNSYSSFIGGIVGSIIDSASIIQDCRSDIDVIGYKYIGGIAGLNSGIIRRCLIASAGAGILASDKAGGITGASGTIQNCAVYCDSVLEIGGTIAARVAPNATVVNCYGEENVSVSDGTVSDANGEDGEDKTLAEMKTRSTYQTGLGWDFARTWFIQNTVDFPKLQEFRAEQAGLFFGINF
jgi:hypothetical protein